MVRLPRQPQKRKRSIPFSSAATASIEEGPKLERNRFFSKLDFGICMSRSKPRLGRGQIKINKGFSENLTYPGFFGYPVSVCSRPHTSGPDIGILRAVFMCNRECFKVSVRPGNPFFLRNLFNYGPLPDRNPVLLQISFKLVIYNSTIPRPSAQPSSQVRL